MAKQKNNLQVRFASEREEALVRGAFAEVFNPQGDAQHCFPLMKEFPDPDAVVSDVLTQASCLLSQTAKNSGCKENVVLSIQRFTEDGDTLCHANYNPAASQDGAIIGLSLDNFLRVLYKEKPEDDRQLKAREVFGWTIEVARRNLEHELRHHKDRRFLLRKISDFKADERALPFDFYLFQKLYDNRIEGFAQFRADEKVNYPLDLEHHTLTVARVLNFCRDNFLLDTINNKEFNFWYQFMLGNQGELPLPYREAKGLDKGRPSFWKDFSKYSQGHNLMRVIAMAKTGKLSRQVAKRPYFQTLDEVKDLTLGDFYRTFYESLDRLGLDSRHEIFPRQESLEAIKKYERKE